MTAAGTFAVVSVNRTSLERRDARFYETRFVQRVRVNGDLHVVLVRHSEAAIDRCGCRAPIFVELQSDRSGENLIGQTGGQCRVAFSR